MVSSGSAVVMPSQFIYLILGINNQTEREREREREREIGHCYNLHGRMAAHDVAARRGRVIEVMHLASR